MKWKRWVLMLVLIVCLISIEWKAPSVVYSSVFTTSEQTEIHLYVQMNTIFKIDGNRVAKEIVAEHQMLNQIEGNVFYTLHLYRTAMHYERDCEYDTINCDENGAIICCADDLGV